MIAAELAERLGADLGVLTVEQLHEQLLELPAFAPATDAALVPDRDGVLLAEVRGGSHPLPTGDATPPRPATPTTSGSS